MKKYTVEILFTDDEQERFDELLNECNSLPECKWDYQTALNFLYPNNNTKFLDLFEFLIKNTKKNLRGG